MLVFVVALCRDFINSYCDRFRANESAAEGGDGCGGGGAGPGAAGPRGVASREEVEDIRRMACGRRRRTDEAALHADAIGLVRSAAFMMYQAEWDKLVKLTLSSPRGS